MNYFDKLYIEKNIKLNNQQKKAVNHNDGHALVLSTAGSGKTTVITARIGRLIYENKLNSKRVLTITFSKMAAVDMKNRFINWFGEEKTQYADFLTIHSFAYKIVRDYFRRKNNRIQLLSNNYKILGNILRDEYKGKYYNNVSTEEIENLANTIGYFINMMIDPNSYYDYNIKIKNFDSIYNKYSNYKIKNNLIDFDDMLIYCLKILKNVSTYKDYAKNNFQYIQVDEVQDTSKIQHEIIKCLTKENLFMVGDDDQAIYSFRGSYPDFLIDFIEVYPKGQIYYLDNNYRSSKHIVNVARKFIELNNNRFEKNIYTENDEGKEVNIVKFNSRAEQSKFILQNIKECEDESIAILYRNNISSIMLANELSNKGKSFFIKEDKSKFFNNFVFLDIIAFLKLAINPYDKNSFSRIYYKCYTYFTKKMCNFVLNNDYKELDVFDKLERYEELTSNNLTNIERLRSDIKHISKCGPSSALCYIRRDLEYLDYIDRLNEEGRVNYLNAMLILEILEEIAAGCKTIIDFLGKLDNLNEIFKNSTQNKGCNINLSTIHSAKGLEYDKVFIIDNINGEFPPDRKNEDEEMYEKTLEEERRIFYVGMTRAKKELFLLVPQSPSLFINEIVYGTNEEYKEELSIGTIVKHKKFGEGRIANIKKGVITISFNKKGIVKLDMDTVLERKILEIK